MISVLLPCLQALVFNDTRVSLKAAVALAAAEQPISAGPDMQETVVAYVTARLEQLLVDRG